MIVDFLENFKFNSFNITHKTLQENHSGQGRVFIRCLISGHKLCKIVP